MKVKYSSSNVTTCTFCLEKFGTTLKDCLDSMGRLGYRVISIIDDNNREIIIGEPK